jgi:hypothetical protein
MENGCPVLPKIVKVSDQVTKVEGLMHRAKLIAIKLAESDAELAVSFMNNVEHLKALGDPMMEWFIESRERGLSDKKEVPKATDSGQLYSF